MKVIVDPNYYEKQVVARGLEFPGGMKTFYRKYILFGGGVRSI